jgi:hypothetical protein
MMQPVQVQVFQAGKLQRRLQPIRGTDWTEGKAKDLAESLVKHGLADFVLVHVGELVYRVDKVYRVGKIEEMDTLPA